MPLGRQNGGQMAEIRQCENYSDTKENRIIGRADNCRIVFQGENAVLTIKEGFRCSKDATIRLGSNCNVEIGENVELSGGTWNFYDDSTCTIGGNSRFRDGGFLNVAPQSAVSIGRGFSIEHFYIIIALPHTQISIGEDCMVSRFVTIQSNDGHDIFDVNTGKNINGSEEIARTRKVIVGDHVWVGQDSMLLYGTEIGSGSIVGAKSLVKGRFPNNCAIGGSPARLLKKDVAWNRGYGDEDISAIDERYVRPTAE